MARIARRVERLMRLVTVTSLAVVVAACGGQTASTQSGLRAGELTAAWTGTLTNHNVPSLSGRLTMTLVDPDGDEAYSGTWVLETQNAVQAGSVTTSAPVATLGGRDFEARLRRDELGVCASGFVPGYAVNFTIESPNQLSGKSIYADCGREISLGDLSLTKRIDR